MGREEAGMRGGVEGGGDVDVDVDVGGGWRIRFISSFSNDSLYGTVEGEKSMAGDVRSVSFVSWAGVGGALPMAVSAFVDIFRSSGGWVVSGLRL